MKKFLKLFVPLLAIVAIVTLSVALITGGKNNKKMIVNCDIIGAGGYGAMYNVAIDPFNDNIFAARCDMGGIYMSFDSGKSWTRHNMLGVLQAIEFDEENEGVVWTGGNGVYKSTDHGRTFELVFPKPETVTVHNNWYESFSEILYSDGDFAPAGDIKHIAINRKSNGQNVFVAQQDFIDNQKILIFETKNGKDFELFTKIDLYNDFKMEYDETNDCLVIVTDNKIFEIDKNKNVVWEKDIHVAKKQLNYIFAFDSYYNKETNTNTFAFSTYDITATENQKTALYVTNDLRADSYTDIIPSICELPLIEALPDTTNKNIDDKLKTNQFYQWDASVGEYGANVTQTFPWEVQYVHIANENCIYFFSQTFIDVVDANGNVRWPADATTYAQYKKDPVTQKVSLNWMYGAPHYYTEAINNASWQDCDSSGSCFGMASSRQDEDKCAFSTMGSVYCAGYTHKEDNTKEFYLYQCHCTVGDEVSIKVRNESWHEEILTKIPNNNNQQTIIPKETTTSGLNVQTTYKTVTDPFDSNHLLMACTDFGLLQSFNNGKTWIRSMLTWEGDEVKFISSYYRNTCYDIEFDKYNRNVVYAVWSSYHDMPYGPTRDLFVHGCGAFGISYDGGASWTMKDMRPDKIIVPYRLDVEYVGNERNIYIATYGRGFFVTHDFGDTFEEMNDGIRVSTYLGSDMPAIFANEILCCKDGIYAITAAAASVQIDDLENPGQKRYARALYKWNKTLNKFEEIMLPKDVACVRDIEYSKQEDCLYIAAIGGRKNDETHKEYGGGIYRYKDGVMTQVFDDSKFVWGLCLDSKGRLYAATFRGEVYRFTDNNTKAELIAGKKDFIGGMFHVLKDINVGANDNILYVSTFGGGMYRLTIDYK